MFLYFPCWECVKNHVGLIKERCLGCTGGGGVPPPMSCRTLGWAMLRKAHYLALAEVGMGVSVSFLVCTVWKKCDAWIKEPAF